MCSFTEDKAVILKTNNIFVFKFLGLEDSFVLNKNQRIREFISYSAFVMLIIRYPGAEEKAKELRKFLLRPILLPPSISPNVHQPRSPASAQMFFHHQHRARLQMCSHLQLQRHVLRANHLQLPQEPPQHL